MLLAAGLLIRLAALPLPGTRDVALWKVWSYGGTVGSPLALYGVGGSPPERREVDYHGVTATVDYPPLSLYELSVIGRAYRLASPHYRNTAALTAAIKIPLILFEIGFLQVAFLVTRRYAGRTAARWAVLAYWLNPAPIFDASILAYLDPLFVLPMAAALFVALGGWPFAAGALLAAAALTKSQAVFAVPAFVLALWNGNGVDRRLRRLAHATSGGLLAFALIAGPVVVAGAGPNMAAALQSITRHDMLSGNACNLWWIVGYLLRAIYTVADVGAWTAFTTPTKILAISRAIEIGFPNPRVIGSILASAAMAWGVWTARRARDPFLIAAVAAFSVHSYATLSAQVHENHLFAAVPLLAIAAAGRPRFRPLLWMVSAIFALNLNLFYGISEYIDGYAIPRTITIIDLTVILAAVNCATLAWHARVLSREGSTAAARRPTPDPASPPAPADRRGRR